MARDRTRKSQEATNSSGTPGIDPQVLTESPRKEHFEEDMFVPQSAPAWIGTFDLRSGVQKFNDSATAKSSSVEVRVLRFSGHELK